MARTYTIRPAKPVTPVREGQREIPSMYYVVSNGLAEAMKGSQTAIKRCKKGSMYGIFSDQGRAYQFIFDNKLRLCATVVEM